MPSKEQDKQQLLTFSLRGLVQKRKSVERGDHENIKVINFIIVWGNGRKFLLLLLVLLLEQTVENKTVFFY